MDEIYMYSLFVFILFYMLDILHGPTQNPFGKNLFWHISEQKTKLGFVKQTGYINTHKNSRKMHL